MAPAGWKPSANSWRMFATATGTPTARASRRNHDRVTENSSQNRSRSSTWRSERRSFTTRSSGCRSGSSSGMVDSQNHVEPNRPHRAPNRTRRGVERHAGAHDERARPSLRRLPALDGFGCGSIVAGRAKHGDDLVDDVLQVVSGHLQDFRLSRQQKAKLGLGTSRVESDDGLGILAELVAVVAGKPGPGRGTGRAVGLGRGPGHPLTTETAQVVGHQIEAFIETDADDFGAVRGVAIGQTRQRAICSRLR